jgi:AraC-like DNA-binding protein
VGTTPRAAVDLILHALAQAGLDVRGDVRLPSHGRDVEDATYDAIWSAAEARGLAPRHALAMARHYLVGAIAPGDVAAFTARDVGGALEVLARAWPAMSGPGEALAVRASRRALRVTLEHAGPEHPLADTFALAVLVDRLRVHAARALDVHRVTLVLPRPAPSEADELERFFGARHTTWSADASSFELGADAAAIPLLTSSAAVHARVLALLPRSEDDALRAAIRRWLARGAAIEDVARALELTPRTLQRRLARNGRTYRALRDEVALEEARWLLADPARSIAEIATRLGFADPSTFTRAFTRWSGTSPARFRERGDR